MNDRYEIHPVGVLRKKGDEVSIEIHAPYAPALLGLDEFSHIIVMTWFHRNDTPEKRRTLQVHPRGNPQNPLSGVFASRSPARPNLIGMYVCRLLSVAGNVLHIDKIDAFDGTPVVDIKPCLSEEDLTPEVRVPEWVKGGA